MNWGVILNGLKTFPWPQLTAMCAASFIASLPFLIHERNQKRERHYFVSYAYFTDNGSSGFGCSGVAIKFDIESWSDVQNVIPKINELLDPQIEPLKQRCPLVILSWQKLK